jgi:hypothetical protein
MTERSGGMAIHSTSLLGVEHRLEQVRHKIVSIWHKGTQQECEEELTACRNELKTFNEGEWRIVRIERHLVPPNKEISKRYREGE